MPKNRSGKGANRNLRILAAILAIGFIGSFLFLQAGNFLVVEDRFPYAQMAVVLSGAPVPRTLAVRDLYTQGKVGEILVIPEPKGLADEELVKLGLLDPTLAPISERILIASSVPKSKIHFLPGPVDGTVAEARQVHRFLRGRVPKSLALVTSKYASRRSRTIFRHLFRKEKTAVFSFPTPYDPFQPDRWWSQPRSALNVAMEYSKFLVNWFMLSLGFAEKWSEPVQHPSK